MKYVIDASVVVKWYNQEEEKYVDQALQVFEDFKNGKIFLISPDILYYEFLNALIVGKKIPHEKVQKFFKNLYQLSLVVEVKKAIFLKACRIAEKHEITIYDAVYAALAKKEKCKLISANPRHHGRIKDGTVVDLKDY